MKDKKDLITRKTFLKRTSAGLILCGLMGPARAPLRAFEDPVEDPGKKPAVPLRVLGRTDIKVTPVGFGASRTMEPTLVKAALDKGINFLDTGRSYSNGKNEVMLGKTLAGLRDTVVIQSKMRVRLRGKDADLDAAGAAARIEALMRSSLEQSLAALKTDFIDIMLIHGASSPDIIEHDAVKGFFDGAKKKGMIRACGFSTHSNQVALVKAAVESAFHDVIMVTNNHKGSYVHSQSGHYSEWNQKALEVELKKAGKKKIGIVAMKTCSGGPYAPDEETEPSFRAAIEWVLAHSYVQTAAVAMANRDEIDENVLAMAP